MFLILCVLDSHNEFLTHNLGLKAMAALNPFRHCLHFATGRQHLQLGELKPARMQTGHATSRVQ